MTEQPHRQAAEATQQDEQTPSQDSGERDTHVGQQELAGETPGPAATQQSHEEQPADVPATPLAVAPDASIDDDDGVSSNPAVTRGSGGGASSGEVDDRAAVSRGAAPTPASAAASRRYRQQPSRSRQPERPRAAGNLGSALTDGDLLEVRVSQLWFWEGTWSRRGVLLRRQFGTEHLDITDLDLVAFHIAPTLTAQMTIGEAKTGTSKNAPRPLDRVIWLAGLLRVVPAIGAELTSAIVPDGRVRRLASSLGAPNRLRI